jgi:hypothetical protein
MSMGYEVEWKKTVHVWGLEKRVRRKIEAL